ncbi:MAG: OmpA family protein [Myxococcales bacterium]|nr:OmpA family protein [Myxococcales bacterium]
MNKSAILFALLAAAPSAHAADGAVSAGLFGGALFTQDLEVIGDTLVLAPRVGYWINPTLGFELDVNVMPIGRTQERIPESFPYLGVLPAVNMVGRVFEDQPVSLILNFGLGAFYKQIDDDGQLKLPQGTGADIDFAGISGPGLLIPFGNLAFRTEYRWILTIGSDSFQNRGASFIHGEWTAGLMYLPTGPKDSDKDGIADEDDACIDQPEDIDEFEDLDGCPDRDNDQDGIADTDEACDNEAEDFDEFEDDDGCPDPDNDEDGILDGDDECPVDEGPENTAGCPDEDGDETPDKDDECVDEAGLAVAFGCPDGDEDRVPDYRDDCPEEPAPEGIDARRSDGCDKKAFIAEGKIVITDKVYFSTGRSTIQRRSHDVLDAVVGIMTRLKGIKKLRVEGHTDSVGDDDRNMELSQSRAEAVVAYLVDKGISEERLVSKGFGETKPVGDNETDEGREQNRRVEFNIEEQDMGRILKRRLKKSEERAEEAEEAEEGTEEAPAEGE